MTARAPTASDLSGAPALSFNLWHEPWINVLGTDGARTARLGIRDCLVGAHRLRALADPSPLVAAGLQRLLAAIAQDIVRARGVADLTALLRRGQFDPEAIDRFGATYAPRFDLFSADTPFLQTADVPPELPRRAGETKPVSYLFLEEPTATNVNHFAHRYDRDAQYAPATAAAGLVTLAAFATSGGAGIKPSINGVPPLYVLPAGNSVFETVARSIITPGFQPRIASANDHPAWARDPVVQRSREVLAVGYLESLTFPARRVRLIPERVAGRCARSGEESPVLVRRMVFEMGHARPKDAAVWLDPFAAYRTREKGEPVPVRPQQGKALWREYGTLFQTAAPDDSGEVGKPGTVIPPAVVQQTALLGDTLDDQQSVWRFRCVGMRTAMKAKVFEWVDETLDVPAGILADPAGQAEVTVAVQRAEEWVKRIAAIHHGVY
ncbi:MAG TPA: type I-E CRISPR-associated protein Cse1/CasA, partial [Gaiellales bacterium]|nr:type I-E CRISPR-associated protein Cse1/CasA [Gaiellales bacterium]